MLVMIAILAGMILYVAAWILPWLKIDGVPLTGTLHSIVEGKSYGSSWASRLIVIGYPFFFAGLVLSELMREEAALLLGVAGTLLILLGWLGTLWAATQVWRRAGSAGQTRSWEWGVFFTFALLTILCGAVLFHVLAWQQALTQ